MDVIFIVLPIALFLAGLFLIAFLVSASTGQFDDLDTPPARILADDCEADSKNRD